MRKINKLLLVLFLFSACIAVFSTKQVITLVEQVDTLNSQFSASEVQECPSLAEQLEARAHELREANKDKDLELYRHEAIREVNQELQKELKVSPFVSEYNK